MLTSAEWQSVFSQSSDLIYNKNDNGLMLCHEVEQSNMATVCAPIQNAYCLGARYGWCYARNHWTSDVYSATHAYHSCWGDLASENKNYAFSVRCVADL